LAGDWLRKMQLMNPNLFCHWRFRAVKTTWLTRAVWVERLTYGSVRGWGWKSLGLLDPRWKVFFTLLRRN
jgi:hypothetical protein